MKFVLFLYGHFQIFIILFVFKMTPFTDISKILQNFYMICYDLLSETRKHLLRRTLISASDKALTKNLNLIYNCITSMKK